MAGFLAIAIVAAASSGAAAPGEKRHVLPQALSVSEPRIVVLKSARMMYLMDAETVVRRYPVLLGPEPAGQKTRAGDGRTPEGVFRICSKNMQSANHRFLGIDYPDPAAARRGLAAGLISEGEAQAIIDAHEEGQCPNWNTALGGAIGIHGSAENREHSAGCIAVLNHHVDELFGVLRIGDPVEILP